MFLSRANSAKLPARSTSPAASAASIFSATSAGLFRRAELILRSANSDGSSCAARIAKASRACGHSAAPTAIVAAMPATAKLSPARFILQNLGFRCPQHNVPHLRHNVPDERRASLGRQDCVEFA
jgi:hypothetical protein